MLKAKLEGRRVLLRPIVFLAAAGVLMLSVVGGTWWLSLRTEQLTDQQAQARRLVLETRQLSILLLSAETGQRGYLLTGEEGYLQPYLEAEGQLSASLDRLGNAQLDPEKEAAVERLKPLIARERLEMAVTVDLRRQGRTQEALSVVGTDLGKSLMDQILGELGVISERATTILQQRFDRVRANARWLAWMTAISSVLGALFAGSAALTVLRYAAQAIHARAALEELNHDLEDKVAARTASLTEANEEIQRFAYIVTHDLRAPLVNIVGFTSELEAAARALAGYFALPRPNAAARARAKEAAESDLPEAISFIRKSSERMDRLINAILRLSREGRRELDSAPVDLREVLDGAVSAVGHQARAAGAEIRLQADHVLIQSDRLALEQVFGNLLENAVKYLDAGRPGEIWVRLDRSPAGVRVTVTDNGRGIAAFDHQRIFELFRRSGEQDRPGEGIGLAHTRALVRRMGGQISLQSELGKGASFTVELPWKLRLI